MDPAGRPAAPPAGRHLAELRAAAVLVGLLSRRPREVLALIGRGLSNQEIARLPHIEERTAKAHTAALFANIGVDSRTELTQAALLMEIEMAPRDNSAPDFPLLEWERPERDAPEEPGDAREPPPRTEPAPWAPPSPPARPPPPRSRSAPPGPPGPPPRAVRRACTIS
ncbi:hypothetical protein GCM10009759_76310 [Kitasatospora saccharophila]|uniref:HTH luxR-type domain-containing protein n=1 Tax=Kitasatospora saccharophila TaxID=407973 RepID=A0ABN2YE62_9ACTN